MLKKLQRVFQRMGAGADILLIILASGLTYLPLIGQLGYYRDDWHVAWGGMLFGPVKILYLHLTDRPVMGMIYSITYRILGDAPLAWQLYTLVMRIFGALIFLWLMRLLWPGRRLPTTLMALLFVLYPGFLQMQTASAYSNHMVGLAAGIFSLAVSIYALKVQHLAYRIFLVVLAILSALVCFFIMEYMIGLEGVRLVLLGYVLFRSRPSKERVRKTYSIFLNWLPYAITLSGFLVWRIMFFKSARATTDVGALAGKYLADPGFMLGRLVLETGKGLVNSLFLSWAVPFYNLVMQANPVDLFASLGIALLVIGLALLFFHGVREEIDAKEDPSTAWASHAMIMGLIIALLTIVPVVLANRDIRFADQFDRYTLSASLGVVMVVVGFLFRYLRPPARVPIFVLLLAVSVITQYQNEAYFRNFWKYQREVWWQLSWRAPALAQDTLLIPSLPAGYSLSESYEVWGPANLIYGSVDKPMTVVGDALNRETYNHVVSQNSTGRTMRRVSFTLDYKNSLVLSLPDAGSCLHVLDGSWMELTENESYTTRLLAPYSRASLIRTNGSHTEPPAVIFGPEPAHTWCYYYQKAGLARQDQNWVEVIRLGDELLLKGLGPQNPLEWMPFYQGYAYQHRMDEANMLAEKIRTDPDSLGIFCRQFSKERVSQLRSGSVDEFIIINLCPQE